MALPDSQHQQLAAALLAAQGGAAAAAAGGPASPGAPQLRLVPQQCLVLYEASWQADDEADMDELLQGLRTVSDSVRQGGVITPAALRSTHGRPHTWLLARCCLQMPIVGGASHASLMFSSSDIAAAM